MVSGKINRSTSGESGEAKSFASTFFINMRAKRAAARKAPHCIFACPFTIMFFWILALVNVCMHALIPQY